MFISCCGVAWFAAESELHNHFEPSQLGFPRDQLDDSVLSLLTQPIYLYKWWIGWLSGRNNECWIMKYLHKAGSWLPVHIEYGIVLVQIGSCVVTGLHVHVRVLI